MGNLLLISFLFWCMRTKAEGDVHHDYNMKNCYYIQAILNYGKHIKRIYKLYTTNTQQEKKITLTLILSKLSTKTRDIKNTCSKWFQEIYFCRFTWDFFIVVVEFNWVHICKKSKYQLTSPQDIADNEWVLAQAKDHWLP